MEFTDGYGGKLTVERGRIIDESQRLADPKRDNHSALIARGVMYIQAAAVMRQQQLDQDVLLTGAIYTGIG